LGRRPKFTAHQQRETIKRHDAGEHRTIRLRPSYRRRCDQPRDRRLGLALAAKKLALREVPAVTITGLDDAV